MSRRPPGRVVANLDAEESWAAAAPGTAARGPLGRAALRRMAEAGSLLRVYCRPGDRLWLPAELDPARLAGDDLPVPTLESGSPANLEAAEVVLRWASTAEWPDPDLAPERAARVNHRRHTLDLCRSLGAELPGSAWIDSPKRLDEILADRGNRPWVLKAPLSAAGRRRLVFPGTGPPPGLDAARKLLRRHGELLFEPWMPRLQDFGMLLTVGPGGLREGPTLHRQHIGPRGAFRGIEVGGDVGLTPAEQDTMTELAPNIADALARDGYRGPASVDFWRYRTPGGTALHPIGEINARWSFGRVARDLARRLFPEVDLEDSAAPGVRLAFGPADPDPRTRSVVLLRSEDLSASTVRLELLPPARGSATSSDC